MGGWVPDFDVAVIGAGISGVTTAKNLRQDGLTVVVLEATDHVGGLWQFTESGYGVMRFTHINVSKHNYCFSDYPFPDNTPDYPHWEQMARYINDYVDHFDVRRHIRFNTRVRRAAQDADRAAWTVETEDDAGTRATLRVRAVAVATGHHAKPVLASFPGEKVRASVCACIHAATWSPQRWLSVPYMSCAHRRSRGSCTTVSTTRTATPTSCVTSACSWSGSATRPVRRPTSALLPVGTGGSCCRCSHSGRGGERGDRGQEDDHKHPLRRLVRTPYTYIRVCVCVSACAVQPPHTCLCLCAAGQGLSKLHLWCADGPLCEPPAAVAGLEADDAHRGECVCAHAAGRPRVHQPPPAPARHAVATDRLAVPVLHN
jgi:hypothetical protein